MGFGSLRERMGYAVFNPSVIAVDGFGGRFFPLDNTQEWHQPSTREDRIVDVVSIDRLSGLDEWIDIIQSMTIDLLFLFTCTYMDISTTRYRNI